MAAKLAESRWLRKGKRLWDENTRNWDLPLSKGEKIQVGAYIILKDYGSGLFPPHFEDQQAAYDAEVQSRHMPGRSEEGAIKATMVKPFWNAPSISYYLTHYIETVRILAACGIRPPSRLLELGCGSGWMAEFLAVQGYDVLGTTISPFDVECANLRIQSLKEKKFNPLLRFLTAPMESVHEHIQGEDRYDAVLVYEALHHAYDWKETIRAGAACLKPGGWLLILHEPNLAHTFVSYRIARLKNTHEIGFSRPAMIRCLKKNGLQTVRVMKHRINTPISPIWLAAQKTINEGR